MSEYIERRPPAPQEQHVQKEAPPPPSVDVPVLDLESELRGPTPPECTEAWICHLGGLLTWIILPLIMMIIKKGRSAFVVHHAREALNFQITMVVAGLVAILPAVIAGVALHAVTVGGALPGLVGPVASLSVGFLVWFALICLVSIWETVWAIVAMVVAARGRLYYYPLNIRLFR
jgi:uncharacterized protein